MKIFIITYNTKLSMEGYQTLSEAQNFIYKREGMQGIVNNPSEIEFRVQDRNGGIYQIYEVNIK